MIYMKEGSVRLAKVPPAQRINIKWLAIKNSHLLGALPMNLTWALGFFLLVIVPLPMDMVALSMAPQSIVYPLGTAVTVIVGQVVAPKCFFKAERLNMREWAGTALIIAGACVASAFGARKNESYKVDDILFLYTKTPFLLLLGLSLIVFIVALYLTHNIERHKIRPALGMMCVAFVPSYLCGIQTISFKSMAELTSNAIAHGTGNNSNDAGAGTSNEWGGPMPWVFLVFVIACAAVQMIYINVGAAKYQATRFFPTYNATLMVCTCTFGAVFFEEYNFWGELAPLFPVGVLVIIVGIVMLSWDDPTDQTTARVAPELLHNGMLDLRPEAAEGGGAEGGGGKGGDERAGKKGTSCSGEDNSGPPAPAVAVSFTVTEPHNAVATTVKVLPSPGPGALRLEVTVQATSPTAAAAKVGMAEAAKVPAFGAAKAGMARPSIDATAAADGGDEAGSTPLLWGDSKQVPS